MKPLLTRSVVLLTFWSSMSFAGVDLTWNDCVLESSQQDLELTNCSTTTTTATFYATFKTPVALPAFTSAELVFDIVQEGVAATQPFWRFDPVSTGGCNDAGIAIRNDVEPSIGPCHGETSPWGFSGGDAGSQITGYIAGYDGLPYRGRLFAAVYRDASSPYPLDPGINYYMAHFIINSARGAACPGCTGRVAIVWSSADLVESNGNRVSISGPDKLSSCVAVNHATGCICRAVAATCRVENMLCTAIPKKSWRQLKSLYR